MKPKKTVYYSDPLKDDFAGTNIKRKNVGHDFVFVHRDFWWKLISFLLYYLIAVPIVWFYTKFVMGLKIENRRALRKLRKTGYFLYGNHTQLLDPFIPPMVTFPKKAYTGSQSRCGFNQIPEKYRHDARCAADSDGFFRDAAIHFRRGNAVLRKKLCCDLSGGACVAVLHRNPAVSLDFFPISCEAGCAGGRHGDDLSPPPRAFPLFQASGRHGDGKRALLPRPVAFRAGGAGGALPPRL